MLEAYVPIVRRNSFNSAEKDSAQDVLDNVRRAYPCGALSLNAGSYRRKPSVNLMTKLRNISVCEANTFDTFVKSSPYVEAFPGNLFTLSIMLCIASSSLHVS